jgi:hypothetical protein
MLSSPVFLDIQNGYFTNVLNTKIMAIFSHILATGTVYRSPLDFALLTMVGDVRR